MGNWSPVVSVSPDGLQRAYMKMPHLLMCDHHKEVIGLEDLIAGPLASGRTGWEHIQNSFTQSGKMAPQREFTNLIWEPA